MICYARHYSSCSVCLKPYWIRKGGTAAAALIFRIEGHSMHDIVSQRFKVCVAHIRGLCSLGPAGRITPHIYHCVESSLQCAQVRMRMVRNGAIAIARPPVRGRPEIESEIKFAFAL